MNIFLKIITSLGFLTVITQFLGIPHAWKEMITVVVGVVIMLVAFFIDRITLFLQQREDARQRGGDRQSEYGHRNTHQAVAPFATSLTDVGEAFTGVSTRERAEPVQSQQRPERHQPVQGPVATGMPAAHAHAHFIQPDPEPTPVTHTPVPQSHVQVQEMARTFNKQTITTPPVPVQSEQEHHSGHVSTPPPAPVKEIVKEIAQTPVPPAASIPKPIRASRYSSTPLSSLNAPAVALHIARAEAETDAAQKPKKTASTSVSAVKKTKRSSSINTVSTAEPKEPTPPAPAPKVAPKSKSRKKVTVAKED